MPEAAFITNQIQHSSALAGLLAGLAIGAVLAVGAVALGAVTVATGGLALAIFVAGAASLGASVGELVGSLSICSSPSGRLIAPPITVLINNKPAANTDTVAICKGGKHPSPMVAQGSGTVRICGGQAARKGDKLTCGASIGEGSHNVKIGGGTVTVREIDDEVPGWLHGVVIALGLFSGVGALARAGICATGIIVRLGSTFAGGYLGGKGGEWLGGKIFGEGSDGQKIMSFFGSAAGGAAGFKAAGKLSSSPLGQKMGLGDPVDVATGEVFDVTEDFALSGLIPLIWKRTYVSSRWRKSLLGYGWHLSFEQYIDEEADDEYLVWSDGEGRDVYLMRTNISNEYYDTREKIKLKKMYNEYIIYNYKDNLNYHFKKLSYSNKFVLTSIENSSGISIQFQWNSNNRLNKIVDTRGTVLNIEYNISNLICKLCEEISITDRLTYKKHIEQKVWVTYEYDEYDNMCCVLFAGGDKVDMQYHQHSLISKTDKNGYTFTWKYDKSGPDARCIHVLGEQNYLNNHFEYQDNETIFINALGYASKYYRNEQGLITKIIDPEGGTEEWEFDHNNNPVIYKNALNGLTKYTYNEAGNLKILENYDDSLQLFMYDEEQRLIGNTNNYGQLSAWTFENTGSIKTQTLPNGNALLHMYDNRGRVTGTRDTAGNERIYEYDKWDNVTIIRDNYGREEKRSYDRRNRCTYMSCNGFDEQYKYDEQDRLIQIANSKGEHIQLEYDGYGTVTSVKDTINNLFLQYTPLGLIKRREHNGSVLQFTYNNEDWLTGITNEKGEHYLFSYDRTGRLTAETGFDGRKTRYNRNAGGRIEQVVKANGSTTDYYYNSRQQIARIQYDADYWEAFEYDDRGGIVKAINPYSDIALERDSLGRVCNEVYNWGEVEIQSRYNSRGDLTASSSNLGYSQQWQADPMGYLQQTSATLGAVGWIAKYKHDLYGFELEKTLPGNVQVQWSRDASGRPLAQKLMQGGSLLAHHSYRWNEADQLSTKHNHIANILTSYSYNNQGYLTGSMQTPGDFMQVQDRHIVHRHADETGNLYETTTKADRTYGPGGRLLQKGNWRYEYDEEGNLLRKANASTGEAWQYEWYGNGMLKQVQHDNEATVIFTYDAFGRRLSKAKGNNITRYAWRGSVMIHEWQENAADKTVVNEDGDLCMPVKRNLVTWVYDNGSFTPCGKIADGRSYSIISDYLGTPYRMYDDIGKVVWACKLDIWGRATVTKGAVSDCPFRYQGQFEDVETGLYSNRFRYYAPEEGLYISQDRIRLRAGKLNLYNYINDLNSFIDPFGLHCFTIKGENGENIPIYRGGNSFDLQPGEYRVTPNGKYPARGLSLNTDPSKLESYGGANKIIEVPKELDIIHTPSKQNPGHHDIIPKDTRINESQFQELLNKIITE